ncbi:MAG: VPLPA-CTERM sorting domain-containing protein [Methylomonas sp.]|nr:VPLPA-CTERM sorting domain-containing protein [Methylomonas sp.]
MLKKSTTGLAFSLILVSGASNAGVWAPTDGDSNFFDLDTLIFGSSTNEFGIFEDTATLGAAPKLVFTGGSTINFSQNGANWDISNGSSSATLLGSYNFQIGFNRNGSWEFETTSAPIAIIGNTTWELAFGSAQGDLKKLYAIDIQPSIAQADVTHVPLPASAWMMGSALLGFVGFGRQKKA